MAADIHVLPGPKYIEDNERIDKSNVAKVLEEQDFDCCLLLGELKDGSLVYSGTANLGVLLLLLERVKHFMVHGDPGSDIL